LPCKSRRIISPRRIQFCKRAALDLQQLLDTGNIGGIIRVKTEVFEQSGFSGIFRYRFGRRILSLFPLPHRTYIFRFKYKCDFFAFAVKPINIIYQGKRI
jgi:hypothetical protein